MSNVDQELEEFLRSNTAAKQVSFETRVFYLGVAAVTTAIPIYMYTNIFGLEFDSNFAVFALVTAFSAFVLSMAYQNVATSLKIKLIPQREKYISVSSELKGDAKKEELKRKKSQQEEEINTESVAYSVMYNNSLFTLIVWVLSVIVFGSLPPTYNYILSVSAASGLLSYLSAAK